MGWDVVQIGLRHNLPIDDPFEMANEVAKRMSRNIRLVCWNDFELDKSNNIVRHDFDYDLIELGEIKVNNSSDYLQMMDSNYKAKQIADTLGFEKVRKLSQYSGSAKSLLRDLDYHRYDIEDEELQISVYNENVDLVYINSCSFFDREADLVGDAAYSGSDVCAVGHLDMQVYNETALLIGADHHALVFSEGFSRSESGNCRTEGGNAAYIGNAEAVCDSVLYQLGEIILRNSDLSDMIFKAYHRSSLLL